MKAIKRKMMRNVTASIEKGSSAPNSLEALKEMVHINVLPPLEIIDDVKNDKIYIIYQYIGSGSLE